MSWWYCEVCQSQIAEFQSCRDPLIWCWDGLERCWDCWDDYAIDLEPFCGEGI